MYTKEGKKILDFTGGLGVLGLGHNHPRIINARINFQKNKKIEVHKIIFSKYMAALSSNISFLLPNDLNKSFFLNSGAEAVEAAIKVCFKSFSKKKNICCTQINLIMENLLELVVFLDLIKKIINFLLWKIVSILTLMMIKT